MDIDDLTMMNPEEIVTSEPFVNLFPLRADVREKITMSMKDRGFDPSHPVHIWRQKNILIDGHMRVSCARELGLQCYVYFHDFEDEDGAFDYAVRSQRDRRNLTDAEIFSLVNAVDRRNTKGGDRRSKPESKNTVSIFASTKIDPVQSHKETAKKTGVSPDKVSKVRAISEDSAVKEQVEKGKKSINAAYREVQIKKKRRERNQPIAVEPTANGRPSNKPNGMTVMPIDTSSIPDESSNALAGLSQEDRVWLSSLPLFKVAANHFLRDDAMIYRHVIPELKSLMMKVIGIRAPSDMTSLHCAIDRICRTRHPADWDACPVCDADRSKGPCKKCKSMGYQISNS